MQNNHKEYNDLQIASLNTLANKILANKTTYIPIITKKLELKSANKSANILDNIFCDSLRPKLLNTLKPLALNVGYKGNYDDKDIAQWLNDVVDKLLPELKKIEFLQKAISQIRNAKEEYANAIYLHHQLPSKTLAENAINTLLEDKSFAILYNHTNPKFFKKIEKEKKPYQKQNLQEWLYIVSPKLLPSQKTPQEPQSSFFPCLKGW